MNVTARLAHRSLRFDAAVRSHLVVSLTAPPLDAGAKRPPVCVIPVLDVSGSMSGDKLFMAKQSLLKLVDHLAPGDRCGVVTFATDVQVVSPAVEMTPEAKAALKLRIGDLQATSSTNLSGGLLEGLGLANAGLLPPEALVRVILFTDGHANHGIATTAAELLPLLDAHRGRATVSAFGYGRDADQELLADLAKRGGGNYAFITGPDAAMTAFARELGGLLSTYATGLLVRVTPAPGARVAAVLSDVASVEEGAAVVLSADDILAEEERHLVLEVELAPLAAPETRPAFQVEASWFSLAGGARVRGEAALAVAIDRVEPPLAQQRPDPALDVLVAQAQLLAAQLEAEGLARGGDYRGAMQVLLQVARALEVRGHENVSRAAEALAGKMRDRGTYEQSAHMRKSMQSGMRRGSSSGEESESATLFCRMDKKVRTRAQDAMDESFKGAAPGNGGEPRSGRGGAPGSRGGAPGNTGGAPGSAGGAPGDSGDAPGSQTPPPPSGRGAERRRSRRW